jgi:S-adenosylmethionine synthetase
VRDHLRLPRPIYQATAAYGHFGRDEPDFTWERTDVAGRLRQQAGLADAAEAPAPAVS